MTAYFLIAAALAAASALAVLTARNPTHGVLGLVVHFAALAALYLSLSAEFLAAVQIIVYAGAVMVLFLFVIALLTARPGPGEPERRLPGLWAGGLASGAVILAALAAGIRRAAPPAAESVPAGLGSIAGFGEALLIPHALPFEMTAFVLLTAAVGVVVLVGGQAQGRGR